MNRISQAEKKRLIAAQQESGLPVREWCKEQGIQYKTFLSWKNQDEEIKWVESKATVETSEHKAKSNPTIQIRASGIEIEIPYSKETISDLMKVLAI